MRLFFHLVNSRDTILDDTGIEVADEAQARTEAMRAIAEFRAEDPSAPRDWSGWTLRVTDQTGRVILTIPLDSGIV